MSDNITIIGIDGGASKVSAHIIEYDGKTFSLGNINSTKEYKNYHGFISDFRPIDLKTQLSQISDNSIDLIEAEDFHAKAYYDAFIEAINEIVHKSDTSMMLIGIGMPGIKSTDGRGIIAMANGPRMPYFADEIEKRLSAAGIALAKPIAKLGSDADYCGIGEEFADKGAFKNIENAYYLGGGTGAADALKLRGKLIPLDECKTWFAKTWEFQSDKGISLEIYNSAKGIQSIYGEIAKIPQSELINKSIYLEQILEKAFTQEKGSVDTWKIVIEKIAELIYERISTIYSGSQNNFSFVNPNREKLDSNHKYKGTLLNTIVIGQRIGNLLKFKEAQEIIIDPILNHLSQFIQNSKTLDARAISHYLKNGNFKSEILATSNLREAPALGAGIDAWNNYVNN